MSEREQEPTWAEDAERAMAAEISEATLQEWQGRIDAWARQTFPDRYPDPPTRAWIKPFFKHLRQEIDELEQAVRTGDRAGIGEEGADGVIMWLALMGRYGIDLAAALFHKHQANEVSEFRVDPATGLYRRVRDAFEEDADVSVG